MINIPLSKQYCTIAGHVSIWSDTIFYCISLAGTIRRSQVTSQVSKIDNIEHPKCLLAKLYTPK